MRGREMKKWVVVLIVIGLLIIDQVVKILVKTDFSLGESRSVISDWFLFTFIENKGAAFGMELGGRWGKLILSLFRLVAIGGIIWFINDLFKKRAPIGVIVGFSLILAGAIGNMIDSAFYGLIFSESTFTEVATMFPEEGGYGTFLHGKVVDMLHFPLFDGTYPGWFPWVGGDNFTFFAPVFNFADSYITIAVFYLIIFQYKFFK